jgi:NADH:ubiquinone oxidoreductase subunit 5 (subunit L)/multisubunit Na+/H+ antiporter MnhA subunit
MLVFILLHDLVAVLLSWDVLGIISYVLVNFWSSRLNCGVKAIVFNKVGDCSFVLLLALSYSYLSFLSTFPFLPILLVSNLFYSFIWAYSPVQSIMQFSLIIVCFTKSAQLPFSSWLLNAMSAPTPISALLHSSTMVIAGCLIGLLVSDVLVEVLDSYSLFFLSFVFLALLTLLWSLLAAVSAGDIKSIIAYSTISQISYMFMALLIDPSLTLFHIIIHAMFKSLLFLFAGSIIHIQYHYQSINRLKTKHAIAKVVLLFGSVVLLLALSKETIIHASNSVFSS